VAAGIHFFVTVPPVHRHNLVQQRLGGVLSGFLFTTDVFFLLLVVITGVGSTWTELLSLEEILKATGIMLKRMSLHLQAANSHGTPARLQ